MIPRRRLARLGVSGDASGEAVIEWLRLVQDLAKSCLGRRAGWNDEKEVIVVWLRTGERGWACSDWPLEAVGILSDSRWVLCGRRMGVCGVAAVFASEAGDEISVADTTGIWLEIAVSFAEAPSTNEVC